MEQLINIFKQIDEDTTLGDIKKVVNNEFGKTRTETEKLIISETIFDLLLIMHD